jgi:hypothetical protein
MKDRVTCNEALTRSTLNYANQMWKRARKSGNLLSSLQTGNAWKEIVTHYRKIMIVMFYVDVGRVLEL